MRPLELVVEGFRSYHDKETFSWKDRRLVAIVGPIGSGKSSILDAISFALFGKTPVFEKDRKALINQRKELCRVELAFEVDGEVWRVIRVIRRSGAAKHSLLRHPEADLSRKPFEMESGDTAVNNRVADLLGLDFTAFCRSVLLAQNRFAEFINSRAGNRDAVLRKVFGFERLDAMQQRAKERQSEAEGRAAELQKQADVFEQDRLQLEALGAELSAAVAALAALEQVAPRIKELASAADEARRAQHKADEELERLAQIGSEAPEAADVAGQVKASADAERALATAREAMERAAGALAEADTLRVATEGEVGSPDALNRAEGLIDKLDDREKTLAELDQRKARLTREQTVARETLEALAKKVATAGETVTKAVTAQEAAGKALGEREAERSNTEAEVGDRKALEARRQALRELVTTREALVAQREQAGALQVKLEDLEGRLGKARGELARTGAVATEAEGERDAAAVRTATSRADLEKARTDLNARIQESGDHRALAARRAEIQVFERERAGLADSRDELDAIRTRVDELGKQLEADRAALAVAVEGEHDAEQARDDANAGLREAEERLHQAQQAHMALALRGDLAVGQPCPVCEQSVGKLPAVGVPADVEHAEEGRKRAREALRAAEEALKKAGAAVAVRRSEAQAREQALEGASTQVREAEENFAHQEERLRSCEQALRELLGQGDLLAAVQRLEQSLDAALREVMGREEDVRTREAEESTAGHALEIAQGVRDAAGKDVVDLETQVRERAEDLAGARRRCDELEGTVRELETRGDSESAVARDEQQLDAAEAAVKQAETDLRGAEAAVKEAGYALDLLKQEQRSAGDALKRLAEDAVELEQDLQRQREGCKDLAARLGEMLGAGDFRELLARARARLEDVAAAVERAAGDKKKCETALEQARTHLEQVRKGEGRLLADLLAIAGRLGHRPEEGAGLSELAARVQELIERERERLDEARSVAVERLEAVGVEREGLLRQVGLESGPDFDAALGEARVKNGALRGRAEEIGKRLEQAGELGKAIEAAHARVAIYRQLRDDFAANRFAAFLLEEERAGLTRLGSERFELLTGGRYRFAPDGSFDVLDLTSAEARRDVKTLSGGETFLAALALALALAERVARSGGRIDAFFLDEGFGSLDPPHLDLAMDGIERLVRDSPNRLVAVVSHVEAMRERIDDLIVLDKDPLTGDTVVRT